MLDMRFDGQVAVVTGAAGALGSAIAAMFLEQGANVALLDVVGADDAAAKLMAAAATGEAIGVDCDIADTDAIAAAVSAVLGRLHSIDVLVNNAAATALARANDPDVLGVDDAAWDEAMRVNLRGTMAMTRAVLPTMLRAGRGAIVNISSGAALSGGIAQTAYAASKAAVISLTRSTAAQYGKQGVRCNAVAPGLVPTPGNSASHGGASVADAMLAGHMTARLGTADDIAAAVCFLASPAAGFITGQLLSVDGGSSAQQYFVPVLRGLRADMDS